MLQCEHSTTVTFSRLSHRRLHNKELMVCARVVQKKGQKFCFAKVKVSPSNFVVPYLKTFHAKFHRKILIFTGSSQPLKI